MKKGLLLASAIIVVMAASGCATIFKGKTQQVNIATSNNEKIDVNVDGKNVVIPGIVELTRKKANIIISTSAKGCTENTVVPSSVEPLFWLNILGVQSGALSSTTDYVTESMWKYDDNIMIHCK